MLIEKTLTEYIDAVQSKASVPGGGSVASLVLALGEALGIMSARYTTDSAEAEHLIAKLQELLPPAQKLIDEDAEAYAAVMASYGLPKSTPEEKADRKEKIQAALKLAALTPLRGVELAAQVVALLKDFIPHCNSNLVSDVGVGLILAEAAQHGCAMNVWVNLAYIKDAEWCTEHRARAEAALSATGDVRQIVQDQIVQTIGA